MYLQFSWHALKISCHVRNAQYFQKIRRTHKILVKQRLTTLDTDTQNASNNLDDLKTEKKVLQLYPENNPVTPKFDSGDIKNVGNIKWSHMQLDSANLGKYYFKLSKFKLTSLVVMTSMMGYTMAPNPFELTSFLSCTIGTGLVSSAANCVNQFLEIPFDAQMSRTKNRVLVQGYLTPLHAIAFATVVGSTGLSVLYYGANTLTAALGTSNLILYTMIYTPLKRISIINTWVGSVVGAIPPLMGWTACQGTLDYGALILGAILYAWQFPHFNALSWNLRPDYSKAGYRMMAVMNPGLCRRTAFRYTLGITILSSLAPVFNLTHWSFGVISLPVNFYFIYLGYKFFNESNSQNSRSLFCFSLLHLPLLMSLMLLTKEGLFTFDTGQKASGAIDSDLSNDKLNSSNLKKKYTSSEKHQDSGAFSGVSLGTTLHAQIR